MRLFAAAALLLTSVVHASNQNTTDIPSGRVLPSGFVPPRVFKNSNLLRNINLEKGYARETISIVVENVDSQPQSQYYLPFSPDIFSNVGGLEVWEKDAAKKQKFAVERTQSRPDQFVPIIPFYKLRNTLSQRI